MRGVYLERNDPDRNMHRFYRLIVQPTLFGDWALIREWGRIGSPGTVRELWFASAEEAHQAAERLREQKLRKGYQDRPRTTPPATPVT